MIKKYKINFSIKEENEDELYLKKLESGLFALQAIVYIIMDIYINGQESVIFKFKFLFLKKFLDLAE